MSLVLSADIIKATKSKTFASDRRNATEMHRQDRDVAIDASRCSTADLKDILAAAKHANDNKVERAVDALIQARSGAFDVVIPNFKAFQGILEAFLRSNVIDGWIYVTKDDGRIYPELVTEVKFEDGHSHRGKGTPYVMLYTASVGVGSDGSMERLKVGQNRNNYRFEAGNVAKKRIGDALLKFGILHETKELKAAYVAEMARHRKVFANAFAQQFRASGIPYRWEDGDWQRRGQGVENHRVIHDLSVDEEEAYEASTDAPFFDNDKSLKGVGELPIHPLIRVFDLKIHEFMWVNTGCLTPYVYDKSLRDKLVLPPSHRNLLDVLTSNIDDYVADIVEGKSAGNIILCKGEPGVGKTLTAEVYAELIEKPLYAIHSGTLGTEPDEISKNLQSIFTNAKRWGAVLLLDEADVFVLRRNDNIQQNAIVAEFLRAIEYYDGLFFMTTNRSQDIDDAIIQRCAAIILYQIPSRELTKRIWNVMATQFDAKLSAKMIDQLLDLFPRIAPRDIKMMLRLVLRLAKGRPLTLALFQEAAMFRAVEMAEDGAKAA
jgi:hypothetical protein